MKNQAFLVAPSGRQWFRANDLNISNLGKTLKSALELRDDLQNEANIKLEQLKKKYRNRKKEFVFVGIHSRRTDHLKYQKENGLIPLKASYYLGIFYKN